jgi:hypothetical protein
LIRPKHPTHEIRHLIPPRPCEIIRLHCTDICETHIMMGPTFEEECFIVPRGWMPEHHGDLSLVAPKPICLQNSAKRPFCSVYNFTTIQAYPIDRADQPA